MPLPACFAITVRDKARTLRRTLNAVLAQQCEPIEILLSDQMSTDGSWEILQEAKQRYNGPHTLIIRQCPETEYKGMPGLNEHLNWQHNQTECEIMISASADDMPLKTRAAATIQAFREHDPEMVITSQYFMLEEGDRLKYNGETGWPTEEGWVQPQDVYTKAIGGSTTQAWKRRFYERIGGLQGLGSPDMVMPFIASAIGKCWFIKEPQHAYVQIADANNTGLEGVLRATEDEEEILRIEELCHMQVSCGIFTAWQKLHELQGETSPEHMAFLFNAIVDRAASWQKCRQKMALKRIQPRAISV